MGASVPRTGPRRREAERVRWAADDGRRRARRSHEPRRRTRVQRRRAAPRGKLGRTLEDSGRSTRTVTLWVRPYWWAAVALCAAAGVLASVVGVDNPAAGLAVAAGAAVLAAAEITRRPLLRLLTPARATQNVVSTAPQRDGSRAVTLIVTAAVDDPRRRLGARLPLRPAALVAGALTLLSAALLVRVLSDDPGTWLDVVQLVPTLVLLAAFPLLLDEGLGTIEPDAAVAPLAVELTTRLDAAPPANVDVGAGARRRGSAARRRAARLARATEGAAASTARTSRSSTWSRTPAPSGGSATGRCTPRAFTPSSSTPRGPPRDGRPGAHAIGASSTTGAGIARADGWAAIAVGADVDFALAVVRELEDSALDGGARAADG